MALRRSGSSDDKSGLGRSGGDAVHLTIDYVKQETLGPLKGIGRFLAFGAAGSLLIAVGVVLGLLGVLRLLQDETGTTLAGDWSWAPYFITTVLGLAVAGLAAWRITAGPGARKLPAVEAAVAQHVETASPSPSSSSASVAPSTAVTGKD
jgi:hypothetical protein